jgi:biopolymer transport protein ExbD
MGEQNILNYNQLVAGHNAEISLPVGHGGLILTNEINTDLHVELDSRGWISIHNYQLSKKRLASLLSSRVEQYGTFRMFVWADEASSFASRTELVQMLDSVGCSPLYFVEASPLEQDDRVEYRAVLW